MKRIASLFALLAALSPGLALGWPNGPSEDPRLDPPNDPGFGGQWNLWSYVPEAWTQTPGFRTQEIAMGTGIHADRAWQVTTGDRRVLVAIHDSGAYWDNRDLVNKYFLNRDELGACKPEPLDTPPQGADDFDVDGSGWFDVRDYYAKAGSESAALATWDENGNGLVDPQDLLLKCSDGVDDDHNGYVDDISGWDFFQDDNDAYDDTRFGHGNGEARDSCAEGNDGRGDIGVCPNCTALMIRVGDAFVTDSNNFGQGVIYSVDRGASVIQSALGAINMTRLANEAVEYAYNNNVAFVASAADELSYHHNYPGSGEHSIYVHAVQYDRASPSQSTTFLNFNNCTNFGMQLLLSTPGTGCSSEAVGITSGHVGLVYSAALQHGLTPPISAEEVKQVLVASADDINVNPLDNDPEKYPSGPGFDWHFGHGRNNARRSVDMVVAGHVPPEVDLLMPRWFEVLDPAKTPSYPVVGRINHRRDGRPSRWAEVSWRLEYALGVAPNTGWTQIATGSTAGLEGAIANWDLSAIAIDLDKKVTDPHQNAVTLRLTATVTAPDGTVLTGQHRKGFLLHKDPTVISGFPKYLGASGESSPIFADIDGQDQDEELVLFSADGLLHVWQQDGSELTGFPVAVGRRFAMDASNPKNVLAACAFRADKAGCETIGGVDPDHGRQTGMMPVAVGDLDADGTLEVVMTTWDGQVWVIEHTGQIRTGFPVSLDRDKSARQDPEHVVDPGFFASPVLYDLDGQPGLEIICAAMDEYIYVWHADGTRMAPWPVRVTDSSSDSLANQDRIVATPAVADIDNDGVPEIVTGSGEVYGAGGVENEAVAYVLDGRTGEIEEGWPQSLYGLTVNVLPIVGRGVVANPMLADLDFDGTLEVSLDTISTQGWIFNHDGSLYRKMNNQVFGAGSDSQDSPAYILMNNGAFGNIDNEGGIDLVKGTAGFDFALAFAGGGVRGQFDHHMSGWDTDSGKMMAGFPRVHDDWQFFNTPTIVDLDNDANPEVVVGSGGYLVRAWNHAGSEPAGFPKQTGGWIIASVGVGELDGDGKFELAVSTRDGWVFVWDTEGKTGSVLEWNGFGHNPHHTNNYEDDPTPYKVWGGTTNPDADATTGDTGESDTAGADSAAPSDTLAGEDTATPPKKKDDGCQGGPVGLAPLLALALLGLLRRRRAA